MKNTNGEKHKQNPRFSTAAKFLSRSITPLIFAFSALLICGMIFFTRSLVPDQQEFVLEEPALRSYFSPLSFSYVDEKKTEWLRGEAEKAIPPVYRVDANINKQVTDRANLFFQHIDEARQEHLVTGESRWKKLPFQIPATSLNTLQDMLTAEEVKINVMSLLSYYLPQGIASFEVRSHLIQTSIPAVLVATEEVSQEELRKTESLLTKRDVLEESMGRLSGEVAKNKKAQTIISQILEAVLVDNLVLDEGRAQGLRKKASSSVTPVTMKIKKDELIIQRGMLITQEVKDRLDAIHKKMATQKQKVRVLAGAFLIFLIYGLSFFYFRLFEPETFAAHSKILLCHTTLVLNVLLCKGVTFWPDVSMYLMPTALAPLLLTLLINARTGIWAGALMAIFGGFLSGFHRDIMLGTLLVTAFVIFLTYRVRKRVHFLRIGLGMGAACFLSVGAFQLAQNAPLNDAFYFASLSFMSAIFTTILAFLLVPILEMFFDVMTDLTLLELSDLNHPLIRKMMVNAPGTYHHSLVVSSLAEHACEMIRANALLAKVGCYFHDIGKIQRPEYFLENQGYLYPNLHDHLPPLMSYEIIVSHVRQGLRLGREYKLKKVIMDFIAEHQGTGVIYYFYKRAMDQALPSEPVRADDYRYPGPKPQSRETAVVLLADSVEAASRSLKDPTPEAIQQLVRKIINDKFIDGQLNECKLTLLDLHKIQDSFVRNLIAIFHTRMKYPPLEKHPESPDLFQGNQFQKFRVDNAHPSRKDEAL